MKKMFLIMSLLGSISLFSQDYIIFPDGKKQKGKVISMAKNSLKFKNENGDLELLKIDDLSVIHISNPDFVMNSVYLSNTSYEKDENGIHIEMLDNPIKGEHQDKKSKSLGLKKLTDNQYRNNDNNTSTININSETSSSLSVTSDDESPKAKVILECDDCSDTGSLIMISDDSQTKVEWVFDAHKGSAFPMEMDIDSGKTYKFKYMDGSRHKIEKKVKIEKGVNIINVWQ